MFFVNSFNFTQKTIIILICIVILSIIIKKITKLYIPILKEKASKIPSKVKYKRNTYEVSLFTRYQIEKNKIVLNWTRIKRFIKRLLIYAIPLIIVIICLLIYARLVFIYGKKHIDENYSIINLVWDIKSEMFTLIFLTYFVNSSTKENERHKQLIERHGLYADVMSNFLGNMKEMCNYLGKYDLEVNPLYTNAKYVTLTNEILELKNNNNSMNSYYTNKNKIYELSRLIETNFIENKRAINKISLNSSDSDMLNHNINNIKIILQDLKKITIKDGYNYSEFVSTFAYLIRDYGHLIDDLRMPWRLDFEFDKKNYLLLYNENSEYITNDYYYRMIIDTDKVMQ